VRTRSGRQIVCRSLLNESGSRQYDCSGLQPATLLAEAVVRAAAKPYPSIVDRDRGRWKSTDATARFVAIALERKHIIPVKVIRPGHTVVLGRSPAEGSG